MKKFRRGLNSAGLSLIEVMIATALITTLASAIMLMSGQYSNYVSFYGAKEEYDDIYRTAQLLLLNEQMCKVALTMGGHVVSFNPDSTPTYQQPIDTIYMSNTLNGSISPTPLLSTLAVGSNPPGFYSPRLTVTSMYLTEHDLGSGRGLISMPSPPGGPSNPSDPFTYSYPTYTVDLNIMVKDKTGPPIRVKPIPLTIAVAPYNGNQIFSCYASASNSSLCAVINATWIPATGQCYVPPCYSGMASPPSCPTGTNCTPPIYFLSIQSNAQPVCVCARSCVGNAGQAGPAGPNAGPPVYYGGGGY